MAGYGDDPASGDAGLLPSSDLLASQL